MGAEKRSGLFTEKVTVRVAKSLKAKFAAKVRKNKTSQAQVARDLIQSYVK